MYPHTENLSFLQESSLQANDFTEETEFLLQNVIAKKLITLIYADGGNGKSWLGFALAKHCASIGQRTVYMDFDNPLIILKERNINSILVEPAHPGVLQYIHRGKCQKTPQELLTELDNYAIGQNYRDWVFIIDSLRNFTSVNNDGQAMDTMTQIMNLREAGATVIILHHCNKDGKNYQGSNNIRNSVDSMYHLSKLAVDKTAINLHLEVKKERASILNAAFRISFSTLAITQLDETEAMMSDELEDFVSKISTALQDTPNLNKTELLQSAERKKDDKTARGWLDKFDGKYWQSSKAGGVFTYQLINN